MLFLAIGTGCLLLPEPNLADEPTLLSDHGYMLIRIELERRERVGMLAMSNVDTDHVVRIYTNSFKPAGADAWMALVPMPHGKYFMSEYDSTYGNVDERMLNSKPKFRQKTAEPASATFEIVSGVINYVGDWKMQISTSTQRFGLNRTVKFDKSTLERYFAQYPEYSNRYGIYLSAIGKQAVSLDDLVKTSEE